MSRVIKFRAWDKSERQMTITETLPRLMSQDSIPESWVSDMEFMQFTGLHDTNEKEIYEGDIVKTDSGSVFQVVYQQNLCAFRLWGKNSSWDGSRNVNNWVKVIGNIYENPELLEGES